MADNISNNIDIIESIGLNYIVLSTFELPVPDPNDLLGSLQNSPNLLTGTRCCDHYSSNFNKMRETWKHRTSHENAKLRQLKRSRILESETGSFEAHERQKQLRLERVKQEKEAAEALVKKKTEVAEAVAQKRKEAADAQKAAAEAKAQELVATREEAEAKAQEHKTAMQVLQAKQEAAEAQTQKLQAEQEAAEAQTAQREAEARIDRLKFEAAQATNLARVEQEESDRRALIATETENAEARRKQRKR